MNIDNCNDCPYWYGDNCECGYLKDCKLNKPITMNFSDIKQFKVDKGIAVPVNHKANSGSFNDRLNNQAFTEQAKQHTYATSAPDGVYDAEAMELVWQYWVEFHKEWRTERNKSKSITFEQYSKGINIPTRKFLAIKPESHLPLSKEDQQKIYWDSKAKEKLMNVMFPNGVDQPQLSPENKQEFGELLANLRDSITNEINKHQSHVVIKAANDLRLTRPYKNKLIGISFMEDIKFMTIDDRCLLADKLSTLTT